jgi:RNA polymerase sigma-70 factor (ECF subfamily)
VAKQPIAAVDRTRASLLERLRQATDEEAWQRFVRLYNPLIHAWALRMGLQGPDAADLVQDVLFTVLKQMPQFSYDAQKSFRGWLRTVTLNKWRERMRRQVTEFQVSDTRLAEQPGPDSAAAFWEEEYHAHLGRRALEVMQADFRTSTWKACWEVVVSGKSATQVAQELGISVGAVHAAKFRVLTRLRQELEGLMD